MEEPQFAVNHAIKAPVVRVVGENLETPGIFPIKEAIKLAEELELDLVEISPNASPPVCKMIDYQKFLYQQKKKQKELKAKTAKIVVKEIRFGPNTDDHDFNFKLKHAMKFLQEGAKVKAFVFFKGRSILYKEQGETFYSDLPRNWTKMEKWNNSQTGRKKNDHVAYAIAKEIK